MNRLIDIYIENRYFNLALSIFVIINHHHLILYFYVKRYHPDNLLVSRNIRADKNPYIDLSVCKSMNIKCFVSPLLVIAFLSMSSSLLQNGFASLGFDLPFDKSHDMMVDEPIDSDALAKYQDKINQLPQQPQSQPVQETPIEGCEEFKVVVVNVKVCYTIYPIAQYGFSDTYLEGSNVRHSTYNRDAVTDTFRIDVSYFYPDTPVKAHITLKTDFANGEYTINPKLEIRTGWSDSTMTNPFGHATWVTQYNEKFLVAEW